MPKARIFYFKPVGNQLEGTRKAVTWVIPSGTRNNHSRRFLVAEDKKNDSINHKAGEGGDGGQREMKKRDDLETIRKIISLKKPHICSNKYWGRSS